MTNTKLFSRMMALFLAMVMLVGMVPSSVFAAEAVTNPTVQAETTEVTAPALEETQATAATEEAMAAEGQAGIVTMKDGTDIWEKPSAEGTPIAHLNMGTRVSVLETKTVKKVLWGKLLEGWVPMDTISLAVEEPTEAPTEAATEAPTEAATEAPTEAPTEEPIEAPTQAPTENNEVLTAPVALDTTVEYFENYFALLHASQDGMEYHFLTSCANFSNPQIHAYPFEVEPNIASIGFEIQLEGVRYFEDSKVEPCGELEIRIPNRFLDSDLRLIHAFDISNNSWSELTIDRIYQEGNSSVIKFWLPNINSRFAILEKNPDAEFYNVGYNLTVGSWSEIRVNNKGSWCVAGAGSGYGNSSTGTFDIHLSKRPTTDPKAKDVGYDDWIAGGCLEDWKRTPIFYKGQTVTAKYGGNTSGWSNISVAARRKIVGYLLYGVRYLSDRSFIPYQMGAATTQSWNRVVNLAYAQQLLIWSAIDGRDPYEVAKYYGCNVPYYMNKIEKLMQDNPQNYDYDATLVIVGDSDDSGRQDCAYILKPIKKEPLQGNIIVDKSVAGSTLKTGWVMEIYDTYSNAQSGIGSIASVKTNSSGRAKFTELKPGQTYYVREAPASRQQNNTDSWTLSTQILSATVEAGAEAYAGTITNSYNPGASFTLQKVSKCSEAVKQQLNGNKMYSLAGARYVVTMNGQQQEILTTDANGIAKSSRSYPVNSRLVLMEIEAPPGYLIDSTQYPLVIKAGDNKIEVADEPVFDPTFAITKVDKNTSNPQGDGNFSGAIFKWEYFDNTTWSGIPKRTWYLKTGENGRAHFDQEHLAPSYKSDPFYVDSQGNPDIPLGTLTMTEIQNTLGYTVLPQPLRCSIVEDPSSPVGATHVFSPDSQKYIKEISAGEVQFYEPIDESLFGSFRLDKVDTQTRSVPQGNMDLTAKFQVVNNSANAVLIDGFSIAAPGEVCYEFTTDAEGHFSTGKIFPLGKYTITEMQAPSGYQLNTEWSQAFTVTPDALEFDFTAAFDQACANTPDLIGSFDMDKLDIQTGNTPQGDATLECAEFEIINNSKHPIYVQEAWNVPNAGTVAAPGEVLFAFKTDASGHYHFEGLPVGSYYIQEKTPPEGYQWDSVWLFDFDITPEAPHITVDADMTCQNYVKWGGLEVIKEDSLYPGSTTQQAPLDGITFTVTNESKHPVVIEDVTYNPGDVVTTLAIAWDGSRWSAKTAVNLPYGTYGVAENEMHPGMANDYYRLNSEKHLVEIRDQDAVATVTHVNAMVEGKIVIHKVDPLGTPLAGAKFGLEWSEDDGLTWNPVLKTESLTKGGCTDPNLVDGALTTGEDGIITFSGLYPALRYRVTELEAPGGYVLLRDSAYDGKLPEYDRVYIMTVHNSPGFTFPTTGSQALTLCMLTGFTVSAMAMLGIWTLLYRKERQACRYSK